MRQIISQSNASSEPVDESAAGDKLLVSLQFPYNINTAQAIAFPGNGGSASGVDSHAVLSTGAAADGFGLLLSRDVLKFNAGQTFYTEFDTTFTVGVANSEQIHGVGNALNGFFFGFDGADFGVLHRSGGRPELQELTITTGSSTAEDITITLDGEVDATVSVSASGDPTITAREIADHIFAFLGTGWGVVAKGDTVLFISVVSAPHPGSYSVSGTTVVGSFAQVGAGVTPSNDWTAQADWNIDKLLGNGPTKMVLDPTKGNVYKIRYHLPYSSVSFFVEETTTGNHRLVHTLPYSNLFTDPSAENLTFPLFMSATNKGNTSNLTIKSAAMAGFVEGDDDNLGVDFSTEISKDLANNTDEQYLLTIRNKQVYQGIINQVRIVPLIVNLASNLGTANTRVTIRFYVDGTPEVGTVYVDLSANSSVIEVDKASSAFNLDSAQSPKSVTLTSEDSLLLDVKSLLSTMAPRQTLLITAQASSGSPNSSVTVSVEGLELF